MENCLFCKIAAKEIPGDIVYEDDFCLAFKDINPVAPVHVLLIPKTHTQDVCKTDEATLGKLLATAGKLAQKLGLDKNGFRLVMNTGSDAGQTVPHLHIHIIGGKVLGWEF